MKQSARLLLICAFLSACLAKPPASATTVAADTPAPTQTPLATPTTFFFNVPRSYIPSATPTFIPLGKIAENLEVISPENIGRLELINRWGKGILLDLEISPDHAIIAAATSTGVYLYRSQDLTQMGYLDVNASNRGLLNFIHVAFSPDSKLLAVEGNGVTLWDIASQTQVGQIPLSQRMVQPWSISFTPDGRHVAVENMTYICGAGGNFALYTIEGYKVFDVNECGASEGGMDGYFRIVNDRWFYYFTNSSNWFEKTFPDEVIKADLSTDQIVSVTRNEQLRKFYDISPDGKLAAYLIGVKTERKGSYTIAYRTEIVDIETGQVIQTVKDKVRFIRKDTGKIAWQVITYGESEKQTQTCNLNATGLIDISGSSYKLLLSNPMQILDLSTCAVKKQEVFNRNSPGATYHFDANGNNLLISGYGINSVLDVKTGEVTYLDSLWWNRYPGYSNWNLGGSLIVLAKQNVSPGPFYIDSSRFIGYELKAADIARGMEWDLKPTGKMLIKVLPGVDSSSILVEDNQGLHLWNLDNGKEERTIPNAAGVYRYPDGQKYIFVASGKIHVWDVNNWTDLYSFDGGDLHYVREISPISKRGRVAILYTLGEHPRQDMRIAVFDTHSGKKIFEIADDKSGLEIMKDQPYFVHKREDGYIELWSTNQNEPLNMFLGGHVVNNGFRDNYSGYYGDVSLSPHGQIFVTFDNGLQFWDVKTGVLLAKINNATISYSNPLFSPDGRILVTTGGDGTYWVWGVKRK